MKETSESNEIVQYYEAASDVHELRMQVGRGEAEPRRRVGPVHNREGRPSAVAADEHSGECWLPGRRGEAASTAAAIAKETSRLTKWLLRNCALVCIVNIMVSSVAV
jgi:hypothetical protein